MIQDLLPKRFHIEYEEKSPSGEEIAFYLRGREVLVHADGDSLRLPLCREIDGDFQFLFKIDNEDFYLCKNVASYPADCIFMDINLFRERKEAKYLDYAGIEAYHLSRWYDNSRFCGHCGHELVKGAKERSLVCPECGNTVYPRINPCIIVAVRNGEELLLTRYAGRKSGYALVAGFMEVGETPEETVQREVMEETGLKVKNIRYYCSQPWGYSESLLLGFTAELDGSPEITVDKKELSLALFMNRNEIEVNYDDFSLTNELICAFKEGRI